MVTDSISAESRVAILYRDNLDQGCSRISTLQYGNGEIRTYHPDLIDVRVGDVVHVTTLREAIDGLAKADGTKYAVPVCIAKKMMVDCVFATD